MKRCLSAGLLLISVCLMIFSVIRAQDPRHYSDLSSAESELQQIRNSRTETDRDLLDRLTFNQYPLFFDEPNARWFYSVDPDHPVTDPTVGYSAAEKNVKITCI